MCVCRTSFLGPALARFYGHRSSRSARGIFSARTHARCAPSRAGCGEFLKSARLEARRAETPRYAHLVALLFLGSAFVIFICALVAAVAMISKSARIAKFAAAGAALTGNPKYFCEADCPIAYSIESITEASTLGPETKPVTAQG